MPGIQRAQSVSLIYFLIVLSFLVFGVTSKAQQPVGQTQVPDSTSSNTKDAELEAKKYELEQRKVEIEEQRLSDARSATKWTAISIAIPILLGFATLYWQARTAYKIKELETNVAFQLKAAEIVMSSKSTKAAEERAAALLKLFPKNISEDFVEVFKKEHFKLPGLAYQEKKMELFKTLAGNPKDKKDIFELYAMLYADERPTIEEFARKWRKVFPADGDWTKEVIERIKETK